MGALGSRTQVVLVFLSLRPTSATPQHLWPAAEAAAELPCGLACCAVWQTTTKAGESCWQHNPKSALLECTPKVSMDRCIFNTRSSIPKLPFNTGVCLTWKLLLFFPNTFTSCNCTSLPKMLDRQKVSVVAEIWLKRELSPPGRRTNAARVRVPGWRREGRKSRNKQNKICSSQ